MTNCQDNSRSPENADVEELAARLVRIRTELLRRAQQELERIRLERRRRAQA